MASRHGRIEQVSHKTEGLLCLQEAITGVDQDGH